MSRELANPISDLFDAAVRHRTIKASCHCGNVGIFDPHALWYLFERKGWNDKLPAVRKRMRCLQCYYAKRKRTLATLELTSEDHTRQLPVPDIIEWKRELRRRR